MTIETGKGTHFIDLDGKKVFVNIMGDGETIIFLHGGPGSQHQFFLPHVSPLASKFKLVLYDQTGCGQSAPAKDAQYSMNEEVKTLELLRQKLGLNKMNLFGESWGSMLALLYATTYPERVNRLFLTAAIGVAAIGYKTFQKELLKRLSIRDRLKFFKLSLKKSPNEEILDILDPYYVFSKRTLRRKKEFKMNEVVNQKIGGDIEKNYDITDKLDKLSHIPIMVAQGSHDILPPSKIQQLLIDYIPHATLVEIQDCGHWTVVEKPDEMNSLAEEFFDFS